MGRFLSFSLKDSTQLHSLSLPGKKTVEETETEVERGTVGGSCVGKASKTNRVVLCEKDKTKDKKEAAQTHLGHLHLFLAELFGLCAMA